MFLGRTNEKTWRKIFYSSVIYVILRHQIRLLQGDGSSLTRRWFISYKEMECFAKQTGICFYTEYPLQIFKNQPVCLVYHGSVEGGEIDLRGRLRIVPHAFADD